MDWSSWQNSIPSQYILQWEQALFEEWLADIFGYYAVQIGLPQLHTLKTNRIGNQYLVLPKRLDKEALNNAAPYPELLSEASALPFANNSIDLITLPHILEFSQDPHALLREVERVLIPSGHIVITGFNRFSLWSFGHWLSALFSTPLFPDKIHTISCSRLKDWLKLLGFECCLGRFGCYRLPFYTSSFRFIEYAGDRWWPFLGAVYAISAVKCEVGMRLVGRLPRYRLLPTKKKLAVAPKIPALEEFRH